VSLASWLAVAEDRATSTRVPELTLGEQTQIPVSCKSDVHALCMIT
jgi:hypothetical protein